jgi:hypothetical protein
MKDERRGLNSNPIDVTVGDKRRALGAKLERKCGNGGQST